MHTAHPANVSSAIHTLLFTHSEHILSMRLNLTEIIRQSEYALHSAVTLTAHHFHSHTNVLLAHLCFNWFFVACHMWRWLMVIALINSFPYRTFAASIDRASGFSRSTLATNCRNRRMSLFSVHFSFTLIPSRHAHINLQGKQNDIARRPN